MALTEKIVWSVPLNLAGVEILSVENNQRPWCVYHDTYSICNVDEFFNDEQVRFPGVAEWTYRRRIHQNTARSVMLLEPGEVHRNTKTPPTCNFSVVQIDPELVNDIAAQAGMKSKPHFKCAVTSDPALYLAFVRFHTALTKKTTLLHRQSLLSSCINALLAGYCEETPRMLPHPDRRRLERARDFLKEHSAEKISLDQLAEISGLSRFHFQRAFTREFGLPPHAYQISMRVQKVRELLKAGEPADDAASEAGFADQSHLIRRFKHLMGITPAKYTATFTSGTKPRATASQSGRQ